MDALAATSDLCVAPVPASIAHTGFNGLLSPLGSELITSPFDVAKEPGSHAAIPFCISGTNGGKPNAEGMCTLP